MNLEKTTSSALSVILINLWSRVKLVEENSELRTEIARITAALTSEVNNVTMPRGFFGRIKHNKIRELHTIAYFLVKFYFFSLFLNNKIIEIIFVTSLIRVIK